MYPRDKSESYRPQRVGDMIREEVASYLISKVQDQRLGFVTITHVKMTKDLGIARIYYTVLGDARQQRSAHEALREVSSQLRHQIAKNVKLRVVPKIEIFKDEEIESIFKVENLLDKIRDEK